MKDFKYIVLWLTNDCNINCKYCYADGGIKKDYMPLETAIKALSLPQTNFKLQLAGGEPLLNMTLIKEIYQYILNSKAKTKIMIQTNGTLIDYEIAKEIKKMELAIGISLDGPFEINEFLRGNTEAVFEGIRNLGAANVMVNLNCVVTENNVKNLGELVELAWYFGNVGSIGLNLLRETPRSQQNKIKRVNPAQLKEGLLKMWGKSEQLYQISGRRITIREIEEAKNYLKAPLAQRNYCYATLGKSLVVLPNGDFYPCGSLANIPKYYMGNINQESSYKKICLAVTDNSDCTQCKYIMFCPGACPARGILNEDNEGYTPEDCILRKTAFEIVERGFVDA